MVHKGGLPPFTCRCQNGAFRRESTGTDGLVEGEMGGYPLLMRREEGAGVRC